MLEDVALGLSSVLADFSGSFQTKTHAVFPRALSYIRGLFKSEKNRANCTAISDALGERDHQSLNHVLSSSPWDYGQVLDSIADRVNQLLAPRQEVGLLLDEVGFRKKGKYSACVSRQYLGCIGKHDNGQVAVVAGLASDQHYCPVGVRLFMPRSWEVDEQRRRKAKIPAWVVHQTKPQLALEMITALRHTLSFDYVTADTVYGSSMAFIAALDREQIPFITDVKDPIRIHTRPPVFSVPSKPPGSPGPPYKHYQVDRPGISLGDYTRTLRDRDFEWITFRDGTRQKIGAYFHRQPVWIVTEAKKGESLTLQLVVRKDRDGTLKYSFTNMHNCSLESIARRQGQRVFVERIFEEGKNQLGMGDYQVRTWEGFHKHMTLCFLAFYYVAYQKITYEKDLPLTAPVIRKLVASTILSRWESLDLTMELCLNHLHLYNQQKIRNIRDDWVT